MVILDAFTNYVAINPDVNHTVTPGLRTRHFMNTGLQILEYPKSLLQTMDQNS